MFSRPLFRILILSLPVCGALAHPDFSVPVREVAALPAAPLGQGAWRFEVEAGWAKLPAGQAFGPTHGGVAVDRAGNVYVSTEGPDGTLVFAPDGKFLRRLAPEFTAIHGLLLREENGKEFLYGALNKTAQVVKLALDGTVQWTIGVPMESGLYKAPADYKPTAIAVAPDGRIFVADGYGASVIHVFNAERRYVKTIGAKGTGDGQFMTCHGVTIDARGGAPLLLVCDRENRRLVQLDLEGNFVRTLAKDLRRPCAVSLRGEFTAVAELEGRVVILDRAGAVVATLGDNPDKEQWAKYRIAPELWRDGIFIAAHGLSFDAAGNLYVQDWNFAGRLTKLRLAPARRGLAWNR
ncbi:MAG: 6-bladed beta-propeller [Opitutaceae bacterium]